MVIKTSNKESIISFLQQDPIINLNVIGVIKNVPEAEIYVDNEDNPKGVFVRRNYFHYIYTKDEGFIDEVCETFFKDGYFGFSGVEPSIAKKIMAKFELDWENPCNLFYMPKENLDINKIKSKVTSIDAKDAEIVDSFYQFRNEGSLGEIRRDILERPSSAIYLDNELVCWVLTHPDNSMGIMYTKEDFRNRGYGVDVTLDLASKLIAKGDIPYVHINTVNTMSPGLAKKCGFVQVGEVNWFGIVVGDVKDS